MRNKKKGKLLSAVMGAGFSVIVLFGMIGVLAGLLLHERIGEGIGEKIICIVHILAVLSGAEISKQIYGNAVLVIVGTTTAIYSAMIVMASLLLEGKFQNIGLNILAICFGFLLSCAFCICKTGRSAKRRNAVW